MLFDHDATVSGDSARCPFQAKVAPSRCKLPTRWHRSDEPCPLGILVGAGCPAVAVLRSVQGSAPDRVDGFELAYVTRDGEQARVALAEAWSLRLERAEPVRRFASPRRRQWPFPARSYHGPHPAPGQAGRG